MSKTGSPELATPDILQSAPGAMLPSLTYEITDELSTAGWHRLGILVLLVTRASELMVLVSTESAKAREGMLGPLGETSKGLPPVIEQPIETLERGIREELGVKQVSHLGMQMRTNNGWFTYPWPVGVNHPGEYAFGICPALYVPELTEQALLSRPIANEEVKQVKVASVEEILDLPDDTLRPGFRGLVAKLQDTGLMRWPNEGESGVIDFSPVFSTGLVDLDLQMGA
ncbi:MAG: hypothetical protein ACREGB_00745 [Candidatus Saccharimonadales bacterium]